MSWYGLSETSAGRVFLTEDQWTALAKLAEDSEYWSSAQKFMNQVDGYKLQSLTGKQLDWYNNIEDKLDREVRK